jgi:hypothetical protein
MKAFLIIIPAAIGGLWFAGFGPLQVQNPMIDQKEIPWGCYERADSEAIGSGITQWNISRGETGVRCMCAGYAEDGNTEEHTGFFVQDFGKTFVVVKAPRGYSDTIGRTFKWKRSSAGNLAD